MKKLFIVISLLSISFAKTVDIKFGAEVSAYDEKAEYIHYITDEKKVSAIAMDWRKVNLGGNVYLKALKSFELKNDIEVKVGAGVSFEVNQRGELGHGFKKRGNNEPSLPDTSIQDQDFREWESLIEELKEIKKEYSSYTEDKKKGVNEMIKISEKGPHYSISSYGSLEVSKKVYDDLKIYGGLDLGLSVLLNGGENTKLLFSNAGKIKDEMELTRTTAKYRPKVKGIFGLNYKYIDIELGLGYPGVASFGIGTRFGI